MRRTLRVVRVIWHCILWSLLPVVVIFWIRSYWSSDWCAIAHAKYPSPNSYEQFGLGCLTYRGAIYSQHQSIRVPNLEELHAETQSAGEINPPGWGCTANVLTFEDSESFRIPIEGFWGGLGFAFWHHEDHDPPEMISEAYLVVPFWLLALAASVFPLKRLWTALRARRRRQRGLCVACGYDLRGSPEKCPECGKGVRNPLPAT